MSAIFQLFFGSILTFPGLQRMEKHSGLPLGFSGGSVVKDLPASAEDTGDVGLMPQSGRSPRGGHGNPSISLPGESDGQKNLVVYSP